MNYESTDGEPDIQKTSAPQRIKEFELENRRLEKLVADLLVRRLETTTQRALDIEITREISHRLDHIFPGPGGPAPEAYAW